MTPEPATNGQVIPEVIRELLEQRSRYQDWLGKLDELRDSYRPEVAERVREDYRGRLAGVETEIRSHRSELERALADRREALDDLVRRHGERSARLEEAEIRFRVGEHDEETWNRLREEAEAELADVTGARDRERASVAEIENVLAEVEGAEAGPATRRVEPGAWPAPPADPRPAPLDDRGEPLSEADGGPADRSGEVEESPEAPEARTGEGLEVSTDGVEAAVAPVGEAGEAGDEEEFLDELEFLESLSLDDPDSFDAVSRMLDEDAGDEDGERGGAG